VPVVGIVHVPLPHCVLAEHVHFPATQLLLLQSKFCVQVFCPQAPPTAPLQASEVPQSLGTLQALPAQRPAHSTLPHSAFLVHSQWLP
jgi:hypothetical protein